MILKSNLQQEKRFNFQIRIEIRTADMILDSYCEKAYGFRSQLAFCHSILISFKAKGEVFKDHQ